MEAPLKMEELENWINTEWTPRYPDQEMLTMWVSNAFTNEVILRKIDPDFTMAGSYKFVGIRPTECPAVVHINAHDISGNVTFQTGAFIYNFSQRETGQIVEVLLLATYFSDDGRMICQASLPKTFVPAWSDFANECNRLSRAITPNSKVVVIGGRISAFKPTVEWDEIILPAKLKDELLNDVEAFFTRGVGVYQRLKLKPFRKLLLAGVPGTGKTMLCSALAKWALERDYLVVYISSADAQGATFVKIEQALAAASASNTPTLVIMEELDAYLHKNEKALMLNVLDGSESVPNEQGTLLIATTNYPEAIDERVLKRPGRLDRIFIIPEVKVHEDAERMLQKYLGPVWGDEHRAFAPKLVGYPGAFIREVAVGALMQCAGEEMTDLPLELLERSFNSLKDQIDARDDFLTKRPVLNFKALGQKN
jgi:ATPase family associated with various cellular activities (AAA)